MKPAQGEGTPAAPLLDRFIDEYAKRKETQSSGSTAAPNPNAPAPPTPTSPPSAPSQKSFVVPAAPLVVHPAGGDRPVLALEFDRDGDARAYIPDPHTNRLRWIEATEIEFVEPKSPQNARPSFDDFVEAFWRRLEPRSPR